MSNTWQKARRPAKQTQLLLKDREDSQLTSSKKGSNVSRQTESKRQPLSSVHRNATPKPLQLKQPASRKLTQSLLKVAKETSLDMKKEVSKENRPVSPSYPSSFMNSHIPKKRVMPQSSQASQDVAGIQTTTATRHLNSGQGSRRGNVEKKEEQSINSSTTTTKKILSEEISEPALQSTNGDKSSTVLKKQNSLNPKPIGNDQLSRTAHSASADSDIILTTKQVHVFPERTGEEQSGEDVETQVVIESELESLCSSSTMKAHLETAEDRIGMVERTGQLHTKDTLKDKSPQVSNDTTPQTPKLLKYASSALQPGSEDESKNMSTILVDTDSYTVQSTTVYSRTDSSPLSDIPTSSTDLLTPDIGYEIHTVYPNPMGHNLPEKLGLLNETQSATIPLSLDASDFDVVPAFPNPTGRRLLEKLALAAQENEASSIAAKYSAWHDETADCASTDEIPSSPIY